MNMAIGLNLKGLPFVAILSSVNWKKR